MRAIIVLAVWVAAVAAAQRIPQKIVGGSLTTISQYPNQAPMLFQWQSTTFQNFCACSILNNRAVLTAAHCPEFGLQPQRWRIRVGSSFVSSGGVVHNIATIILHPSYNPWTVDSDIAIMRTATNINYVINAVQPALIAGTNYNLGDNQVVWAAGWGSIYQGGPLSDQLRHVQIWTVNQNICAQRYATVGYTITANMLCAGWLDVGGRDQCQGDSGSPLYHNRVVVGVCSWGEGCALPFFPGVSVRVSRFTPWIQANA